MGNNVCILITSTCFISSSVCMNMSDVNIMCACKNLNKNILKSVLKYYNVSSLVSKRTTKDE